jgi:hypothetical protein
VIATIHPVRFSGILSQFRKWFGVVLVAGLSAFQTANAQVTNIFTRNHSQAPVNQGDPDGTGDAFGSALTALGGGRFAVGTWRFDQSFGLAGVSTDAGQVWYSDTTGVLQATEQPFDTFTRKNYGYALAKLEDGRLLVGGPAYREGFPTTYLNIGRVYRLGGGAAPSVWSNPDPPSDPNFNGYFGFCLAGLPGNRFAASSGLGFGKVFILMLLCSRSRILAPTRRTCSRTLWLRWERIAF